MKANHSHLVVLFAILLAGIANAASPALNSVLPKGGQRGTDVELKLSDIERTVHICIEVKMAISVFKPLTVSIRFTLFGVNVMASRTGLLNRNAIFLKSTSFLASRNPPCCTLIMSLLVVFLMLS